MQVQHAVQAWSGPRMRRRHATQARMHAPEDDEVVTHLEPAALGNRLHDVPVGADELVEPARKHATDAAHATTAAAASTRTARRSAASCT